MINYTALQNALDPFWDASILPSLKSYIRIPCLSPNFDPDWAENGHIAKAIDLVETWVRAQALGDATLQVLEEPGRTPLLLLEVQGKGQGSALLYGHLDKQPPMEGWKEGLGPWQPVQDAEGRLYGRGGADDGYAIYSAVAAIKTMQEQGIDFGRLLVLIECSEESGSPDLPVYLERYANKLGTPDLVVCLDSGCGNYDQLWSTTSLRGLLTVDLEVKLLQEAIHSGMGGGMAPNPWMVIRRLLDRIENSADGSLIPSALYADIPEQRQQQAVSAAQALGAGYIQTALPLVESAQPLSDKLETLLLNNTWRPALAITGVHGLPALENAGNVLLDKATLRLSFRLPPTINADAALEMVKKTLQHDPPFGAEVTVQGAGETGWDAPALASWLENAAMQASQTVFGKPACYLGLGGSIPFMGMMGAAYPNAQFCVTGVLGPASNAHGPNEFLHVPYAKKITACLVYMLAEHTKQF